MRARGRIAWGGALTGRGFSPSLRATGTLAPPPAATAEARDPAHIPDGAPPRMPAPDALSCARPAKPVGDPRLLDLRVHFRTGADPAPSRRAIPEDPPQPAAAPFAPRMRIRSRIGARRALSKAFLRRAHGAARAWPSTREAARQAAGARR